MAGVYLRDTNAVTESVIIDTPTGGVEKGDVRQVGDQALYGFCFTKASLDTEDTANYATQVTVITKARQTLVSKGSIAFDQGDVVYYTLATGLAAATAGTGKIKVGRCLETVATGPTGVLVNFEGDQDEA
jgi:hypothetical protein